MVVSRFVLSVALTQRHPPIIKHHPPSAVCSMLCTRLVLNLSLMVSKSDQPIPKVQWASFTFYADCVHSLSFKCDGLPAHYIINTLNLSWHPGGNRCILPNLRHLYLRDLGSASCCMSLLHPHIHHLTIALPDFPDAPFSSSLLSSVSSCIPCLPSLTILLDDIDLLPHWRPLLVYTFPTHTMIQFEAM